MQKLFYIFVLLWSLFFCLSCSSVKKLSEMTFSSEKNTTKEENERSFIETRIDTSKMSGLEITYTRIEYFDPARNAREYETGSEPEDSVLHANNIPLPSEYKPPENKKPKGAVKSIEMLSVNKVFSKTGKVENRAVSESEKTNHEHLRITIFKKSKKHPFPIRNVGDIFFIWLYWRLAYFSTSSERRFLKTSSGSFQNKAYLCINVAFAGSCGPVFQFPGEIRGLF